MSYDMNNLPDYAKNFLVNLHVQDKSNKRVLIDWHAKCKLTKDTDLAYNLAMDPNYHVTSVNNKCSKFKLRADKLERTLLICNIKNCYKDIVFEEGTSCIVYKDSRDESIPIPMPIIKFVKSLLLGQISSNEEFSNIVSKYLAELTESLYHSITHPITVKAETPLEKIVVEELNEFYKEILVENKIEYSEVLKDKKPSKKRKKSKKSNTKNTIERVEGEIVEEMPPLHSLDEFCSFAVDDIID